MLGNYDERPFQDHREDAPISMYVLNDNKKEMQKISCIYCKRTVYNLNGVIDKIITTPMPVEDFGIAVNIQCKQCHMMYRLLINAKNK